MSRPRRRDFAGARWHITNRGVDRRDIVRDDRDRLRFVRLLAGTVQRFAWQLIAWVLMSNHFHFLIETPEPTLSAGMQRLEGKYADIFNHRHERSGHLFQGRFDSRLVDSGAYMLEVVRYDVLNPVRAGIAPTAADWIWSSHRATAGLDPSPPWLQSAQVLDCFDGRDQQRAKSLYRDFVDAGAQRRPPWKRVGPHKVFGSPQFVAETRMALHAEAGADLSSSGERQGPGAFPDLLSVRAAVEQRFAFPIGRTAPGSGPARMAFAFLAHQEGQSSHGEIADLLNVGTEAARKYVQRAKDRMANDIEFAKTIEETLRGIRS